MPPLHTPDEYSLETICYDGVVIRSHFEADNEGLGPAVYHEVINDDGPGYGFVIDYHEIEEISDMSFVVHTIEGYEMTGDTEEFVAAAHRCAVNVYIHRHRSYHPELPTLKDA